MIVDNIGVPNAINLSLSDSVTVGSADGEILVALNPTHRPTAEYLKALREQLPRRFPDLEFFTQPADIVSQILNFGLPAPIDIQVTGPLAESNKNFQVAQQIANELKGVPGAADVHVQQILDAPRIMVDSDRALAQQIGLTQRDVANSLLDFIHRQRNDHAEFLAQSQQRREPPSRGPDAPDAGRVAR